MTSTLTSLPAARGEGGYHLAMQFNTGTVINGKVVIDGAPLAEGTAVAVLTRVGGQAFALPSHQEDELLLAMAEIDRGEYVTLEQLLDTLPRRS